MIRNGICYIVYNFTWFILLYNGICQYVMISALYNFDSLLNILECIINLLNKILTSKMATHIFA